MATQAAVSGRFQFGRFQFGIFLPFGIFTVVVCPMRKFFAFETHPIGEAASGTGNG